MTSAPSTSPSKPSAGVRERAPVDAARRAPRAETSTRDRPAVAGGAPGGGQRAARARGSTSARSASAGVEADVGRRARDLAVRGEAELRVGDPQVLGAEAGLVAHRAPGERRLAGEQRGRAAASPSARSVAPPSKVRSKPPLSGVTLPSARRSTAPPSGRSAMPAKIARSATRIGVAAGVDQVRELAGAEDRQAVAAELELADRRPAPPGGSAASAKRSMRVAERARDLRVGVPDAGGEALDVDRDVAPRRVVEVLREAAEPQRHVLHLDVGGLEPVEHDEAVPAAGVAEVDVQHRRLQPGAPARHRQHHRLGRPGRRACRSASGRAGSRRRRSRGRRRGEHRAGDVERVDPQRRRRPCLTPLTRTVLSPAKKSRKSGGTSGAISPVKSTSKPRPSSPERSATSPSAMRVPAGVEREGDVDVVERPGALDASGRSPACPRSGAAWRRCRPAARAGRGRRRAAGWRWRSRPSASASPPGPSRRRTASVGRRARPAPG